MKSWQQECLWSRKSFPGCCVPSSPPSLFPNLLLPSSFPPHNRSLPSPPPHIHTPALLPLPRAMSFFLVYSRHRGHLSILLVLPVCPSRHSGNLCTPVSVSPSTPPPPLQHPFCLPRPPKPPLTPFLLPQLNKLGDTPVNRSWLGREERENE